MEKLIKANIRLFDIICKLHPMIDVSNKDQEELYLALHECKHIINNIINSDKIEVVIEELNNKFSIFDESGQCIEFDFDSYEEAEMWATDNNYNIIHSFNI